MKTAAIMSATEIAAELKVLGDRWDALHSEPDEGSGGSPGEWMVERMGELETEQRRKERRKEEGELVRVCRTCNRAMISRSRANGQYSLRCECQMGVVAYDLGTLFKRWNFYYDENRRKEIG